MFNPLGRPLAEALSSLPEGAVPPRIVFTSAPVRSGLPRQDGTARVIACKEGVWIAARFHDQAPKKKEDA